MHFRIANPETPIRRKEPYCGPAVAYQRRKEPFKGNQHTRESGFEESGILVDICILTLEIL
jgi:hypothetical protein